MSSGILSLHTAHRLRKQKLHLQQLNPSVPVADRAHPCTAAGPRAGPTTPEPGPALPRASPAFSPPGHHTAPDYLGTQAHPCPWLPMLCAQSPGMSHTSSLSSQDQVAPPEKCCQPRQVLLCSQGCTGGGRCWPHSAGLRFQQSFCAGRRFDFPKAPAFQPFCSLRGAQHVSNSGKT